MAQILIALGVLGGLGLLFGVVLGGASVVFAVKKDDRVDQVRELLPGANCGGCGYAGCDNFAAAVVAGEANPGGCPVNTAERAAKIGEILGIAVAGGERVSAMVLCRGAKGVAEEKYRYYGIEDCAAANRLAGGPKECAYACLGLGSCVKACKFGAIAVKDGVAVVDPDKCTACGMCVKACPKQVIGLVPYQAKYVVACRSKDKGNVVTKACRAGCIGCRLCEKACPVDAIRVEDNLARIDYQKCIGCGECALKCPRGIIVERK